MDNTTQEVFHFWDEINKVINGEQTREEFFQKFDEAATREIEANIQKRINELIDLKAFREELQ